MVDGKSISRELLLLLPWTWLQKSFSNATRGHIIWEACVCMSIQGYFQVFSMLKVTCVDPEGKVILLIQGSSFESEPMSLFVLD